MLIVDKDKTQKKIIDAASELLINSGYEKLSIRKIAKELDCSPGLLYNYFKDKNEIIKKIIDNNIDRICNDIISLNLLKYDPKEALKLGLTTFIKSMLENEEQYKAIILSNIDLSLLNNDVTKTNELKELLIKVLNNGVNNNVFEIQNIEATSIILVASTFGLINILIQDKIYDKEIRKEFIKLQVDILIKGLSK